MNNLINSEKKLHETVVPNLLFDINRENEVTTWNR